MDISTFGQYKNLLPYFFWAFLISFLLSPILGELAKNLKIVDLPKILRKVNDRGIHKVLHDRIVPKSGGLAVVLSFVFCVMILLPTHVSSLTGILVGVLILFLFGILDDRYDLPGKVQLLGHFLASLAFVLPGSAITQIGGDFFPLINLSMYTLDLGSIGNIPLQLNLPADLLTIAWIMIVINAIAWIDALDGLQTGICIIIVATIGVVSLALGNYLVTLLSIILLGSLSGFLPFNFLPAKAFNGTVGSHTYGYLIAILAILGDTKSASSILVLLIPLIDMVWVLIGRIHRNLQINPIKLLAISDKTHLHHRFLDMGFSKFQVIITEYLFVGIFAIATIAQTGSNRITLLLTFILIGIAILLSISIILKVKRKRDLEKKEKIEKKDPTDPETNLTPEQKYAY